MFSIFLKQDCKYNWLKQQIQRVVLLEACPVPQTHFLQSHTSTKWRTYTEWSLVKSLTDFIALKEDSKANWRIKPKFPGLNSAVSPHSIHHFQSLVAKKKKGECIQPWFSPRAYPLSLLSKAELVKKKKKRHTKDSHYHSVYTETKFLCHRQP